MLRFFFQFGRATRAIHSTLNIVNLGFVSLSRIIINPDVWHDSVHGSRYIDFGGFPRPHR